MWKTFDAELHESRFFPLGEGGDGDVNFYVGFLEDAVRSIKNIR